MGKINAGLPGYFLEVETVFFNSCLYCGILRRSCISPCQPCRSGQAEGMKAATSIILRSGGKFSFFISLHHADDEFSKKKGRVFVALLRILLPMPV